jgi:membrane protein YqaA with SNARE-associated domain
MINYAIRTGNVFQDRLSSLHLTLIQKASLFVVSTALLVVITLVLLPLLDNIGVWGYLAAFVVSAISSATVVIPGPGFAAIMVMAKDLNWLALGIVAGIGGTLGEMTAYYIGKQGTRALDGHKSYVFFQQCMRNFGGGIIFVFALIPLIPIDAAGLIAGAVRYPILKFLIYLGIGKVIMTATIMYLAAKAFEWAEPYLEFFA